MFNMVLLLLLLQYIKIYFSSETKIFYDKLYPSVIQSVKAEYFAASFKSKCFFISLEVQIFFISI